MKQELTFLQENDKKDELFNELVKAVEHAKESKINDFIDLFLHAELSKEEAITAANKSPEVIYYNRLLNKAKELNQH